MGGTGFVWLQSLDWTLWGTSGTNEPQCGGVSGPPLLAGTYIPRKEVVVVESIKATVIRENQAIRLRARKEFQDRSGVRRVTGEEWQVRKVGAYLPSAHEEVVDIVNAFILTDKVGRPIGPALQPLQDSHTQCVFSGFGHMGAAC